MNKARSEGTKRSWCDSGIRERRTKRISEVQLERSDDMSRISRGLWQDDVYKKHQKEAREQSRALVRESWPRVYCQRCGGEIVVQPCRANVTKFCSRKCQIEYKTGRPNLKNRGRAPSKRAGSGISGRYKGQLFRSLYELSFIINVLEVGSIKAEYETMRIPLGDGHFYIPDFVSHSTQTIYEIKYEKALLQPKNVVKLDVGRCHAEAMGYTFEVYTEKRMSVLALEEVVRMVKAGSVVIHSKKNGGGTYQLLMKKLENVTHV